MTKVSVGKDAHITKSMMVHALDFADELKSHARSGDYSDTILHHAIDMLEAENPEIEANRIAKGISRDSAAAAMDAVIHKRQKLTYIIHPFRKILPKWLMREIPLPFLDSNVKGLNFLDKYTRKIKKI